MQQYRTRPRIISDILLKAHSSGKDGGANISGFMRSCNLSYSVAAGLLSELVGAGLLLESRDDRTVRYKISERGSVFLDKYGQLQEFVQAYGLRL
jgi:predicted transcriptional regulator